MTSLFDRYLPPAWTADDFLDVDTDMDSGYLSKAPLSEAASIASVSCKGYFRHGRRYLSLREEGYHMPTDDMQWESMSVHHEFDLFSPPPPGWAPPNCVFDVDDATKPWVYDHKFALVHMCHLLGAMNKADWNAFYRRIYNELEPGGWIEQVEGDIGIFCGDDTLPKDSIIATNFRQLFLDCGGRADRSLETIDAMRAGIEAAGFISVQQQDYRQPVGTWPKLQVYKDAGVMCKEQFKRGVEGWVMYFLTTWAEPRFIKEEVQAYLGKLRAEIYAGWHIYQKARRVWAQKPYDS